MGKYIAKRLLQLIIVILGVTFLTYLVTQATPSDPAEMLFLNMGIVPTDAQLSAARESMGLNDPFIVQYGRWLLNLLRGNLGNSYNTGNSIFMEMTLKLPETIKLAGFTLLVVVVISFPLGILQRSSRTASSTILSVSSPSSASPCRASGWAS